MGREGEREGEKHQCVVASHAPPTGVLAHKPDMCPDWESNRQPFGSQAHPQSTEPHQPGLDFIFFTTRKLQMKVLSLPRPLISHLKSGYRPR